MVHRDAEGDRYAAGEEPRRAPYYRPRRGTLSRGRRRGRAIQRGECVGVEAIPTLTGSFQKDGDGDADAGGEGGGDADARGEGGEDADARVDAGGDHGVAEAQEAQSGEDDLIEIEYDDGAVMDGPQSGADPIIEIEYDDGAVLDRQRALASLADAQATRTARLESIRRFLVRTGSREYYDLTLEESSNEAV